MNEKTNFEGVKNVRFRTFFVRFRTLFRRYLLNCVKSISDFYTNYIVFLYKEIVEYPISSSSFLKSCTTISRRNYL